jgi:hypothetical protein
MQNLVNENGDVVIGDEPINAAAFAIHSKSKPIASMLSFWWMLPVRGVGIRRSSSGKRRLPILTSRLAVCVFYLSSF